ncbi:MAG: DEAD/DEAH box helicase [Chitinophagaceae bacterium]
MGTPKNKSGIKISKKLINKKARKAPLKIQIPLTRKPDELTDQDWQINLRQQMAQKENFKIKNQGSHPAYSDYQVFNPQSKNTYKVALRSKDNSLNFCSCPDFKTNQLGTCKHIEGVRIYLKKKRGIKKLMDQPPVLSYTSMYVSYWGERRVKLRIGTDNQEEFKKWARKYFDPQYHLLPEAYFKMENLLKEASFIYPSFRCYEDALEFIISHNQNHQRGSLIEKKGTDLLQDLVRAKLFHYQEQGILFSFQAGRAILADEMGLGKTLQAIGWSMLMQKQFNTRRALIICPTSLKYQWKTEIEKFTGLPVTVIEGNVLTRRALYEKDENYFQIVSYHMAGNDWEEINRMEPDLVILDEAQRIKNWKTKISQNIKRIRSSYALVLTGTPIENNIEELYSLVQFINPFLLGSLHHFLGRHQQKDPKSGKVTGYKDLNGIGQQLSGILLRRTRKEVLKQLPERMDKNLFVPLTQTQGDLHTEYGNTVARLVDKWKRFGFLTEQERQRLLNCLNMMRMVCDSTYIIDQQTNYQTKLDELFNILDELLVMEGEKVVIFSQWERMTRLISIGLTERKFKFQYLHGGVPSKQREMLFTHFNNDPECKVFLSTDAGSVGLNLQVASNLINMDIPWNPAVLEQRISRIYRMGQSKRVSVTNLIAQYSIEHRMLSVLKFKTAVAAGILDNGEDIIFLGDDRFKQFMESVEAITRPTQELGDIHFDPEEKEEIEKIAPPAKEDLVLPPFMDPELPLGDGVESNKKDQQQDGSVDLVQKGVHFFSQMINTLSDPQAMKNLASTITEKDLKTGQTYLKVPIANEEMVEKALSLLAGFLKGGPR